MDERSAGLDAATDNARFSKEVGIHELVDEVGVWRIVSLAAIRDLHYQPYREETSNWANQVNWMQVNDLFRAVLLGTSPRDSVEAALDQAGKDLGEADREVLDSLWSYPITASPVQITNGGHRIASMLAQNVRWTIGYYTPEDVGQHLRTIDQEPF